MRNQLILIIEFYLNERVFNGIAFLFGQNAEKYTEQFEYTTKRMTKTITAMCWISFVLRMKLLIYETSFLCSYAYLKKEIESTIRIEKSQIRQTKQSNLKHVTTNIIYM